MLPGFTAAQALGGAGRPYRSPASAPDGAAHALVPQQRTALVGDTGLPNMEAPATTCTCPCCQTVNGRLYCC